MAELKNKPKTPEKVAQFDPNKNYKWEPDAQFILSGAEYDMLFKALRGNLQNPEFIAHINQYKALELLEKVFVQGVESGVIVEIPQEEGPIDGREDVAEEEIEVAVV